jgi:hypothetical protein
MSQAEERIRNNKNSETVILYDASGKGIFIEQASGTSVDISHFLQQNAEKVVGGVLTHNHPNARSFSAADVETGSVYRFAEVRAVSRLYTFSIRPPEGMEWDQEYWDTTLGVLFRQYGNDIVQDLNAEVDTGNLTREEADIQFMHKVWARFDAEGLVRYTRSERRAS